MLELLGLAVFAIGLFFVVCAPELIGQYLADRKDYEAETKQREALLDRKIQIAEEAQAARTAGRSYMPPEDWDA